MCEGAECVRETFHKPVFNLSTASDIALSLARPAIHVINNLAKNLKLFVSKCLKNKCMCPACYSSHESHSVGLMSVSLLAKNFGHKSKVSRGGGGAINYNPELERQQGGSSAFKMIYPLRYCIPAETLVKSNQ